MAMVNKTSGWHFKVKNTPLKHTDGKGSFKRMLSFLQDDKGRLFFLKTVLRGIQNEEIFSTADRSTWPVLKRHQAAKFLKNFQVHFVLCSQENYVFVYILFHLRRPRGSQSGRKERRDESFQVRAKEPLGTVSHRAISKILSGCRLLIGHKKCFVLLCPIGEQFLLNSFREFVHDGY